MALFPLILLGAAGGALYLLTQPTKKKEEASQLPSGTPGVPVVVPASSLPTPPGGTPAEQMPGGPPTIVVTPPGGASTPAQTPQQVLTQALPQLMQNLPTLIPTQVATTAPPQAPEVKTVPAPGQPATPQPAQPVQTPAQVLTQQLPTAVTQVLQQAAQAMPPTTPLQSTETSVALDPNGTVALAKVLIDRESSSGWKSANTTEVAAWQKRVGLTADGKFGEKSALRMAQEVGVLPLVRYFPANTAKETEVPKYQSAVNAYAATVAPSNPAHAVALRSSAAYDVGYGFAASPSAIPVSMRSGQADLIAQALKL